MTDAANTNVFADNVSEPTPSPATTVPDATAPAGAPEGAPAGPPDVSEQIAALATEVRALRQPEQPQEEVSLQDLLSYDPYGGQGEQPQDQTPQVGQAPQQGGHSPEQAEALFNQAIQERVQDAVYPYLEAVDREMRRTTLERMADELPELKDPEVVRSIRDRLAPVAQQYEDPSLLSHPELVRQAVLAERALRAASSEVPAEQARNQGASLEVGAGASAPQDEDPVAAFKRDFLAQGTSSDVFT